MADPLLEADQAERVLNDPTFQAMMSRLEDTIVRAWKNAATVQDRERYHAMLSVHAGLTAEFRKTIDAGQFEKARRKLRA